MTRGEIQLLAGILAALLLGAIVQWSRARDGLPASPGNPTAPAQKTGGWTKAPYVFETRRDLEATAEALKKAAPETPAKKN